MGIQPTDDRGVILERSESLQRHESEMEIVRWWMGRGARDEAFREEGSRHEEWHLQRPRGDGNGCRS